MTKARGTGAGVNTRRLSEVWAPIRHPYLLLLAVCLLLHFLFDLSDSTLCYGIYRVVLLLLICEIFGGYLFCLKWQGRLSLPNLLPAAVLAGVAFATAFVLPYTPYGGSTVLLLGLIALLAAEICMALFRRLDERQWVLLILAAGFVLRLGYVLYTGITTRQHDVGQFGQAYGHAYYIQYVYEHLALPDFDPRQVFQLYQPPLHYILAALWMRLGTAMGMPFERACENLQFLSLFYSSTIMVTGYKILRILKLRKKPLLVALAFFAMHPTFLLFAGYINNDPLAAALTFGAVLAALRWYRKPTFRRILVIALTLGLAMMTKLSSGIVAPVIAFLFAWNWLVLRRRETPRLLLQFVLFGLICFPLALWWSVRNYVRFDMELGYVPLLSKTTWQYIGEMYTPLQRLLEIKVPSLQQVFICWEDLNDTPYCEYNMLLALAKTAVFGEFTLFRYQADAYWYDSWENSLNRWGIVSSHALFWLQAVLLLFLLAGAVTMLLRRGDRQRIQDVSFLLLAGIVLAFYIRFCFQFPHTCSQNMRYTTPLLLCSAVFLGRWMQFLELRRDHGVCRVLSGVTVTVTVLFLIATAAVYLLLGL